MSSQSRDAFLTALASIRQDEEIHIKALEFPLILENGVLNTIVADTSFSRVSLLTQVVASTLSTKALAVYIDIDTIFTVHLESKGHCLPHPENLVVFLPNDISVEEAIVRICGSNMKKLGLIVFDSVTNFYHISEEYHGFAKLNRILGTYLSLLQNLVSMHGAPLLATTLLKSKVVLKEGASTWIQTYAGGRILENMSKVILILESRENCLRITIIKHPRNAIEGRILEIPITLD